MALGLILTTLPLLSQQFPVISTAPVLTERTESDCQVSETDHHSETFLYTPPWIPAVGGTIILVGGWMLGRHGLYPDGSFPP